MAMKKSLLIWLGKSEWGDLAGVRGSRQGRDWRKERKGEKCCNYNLLIFKVKLNIFMRVGHIAQFYHVCIAYKALRLILSMLIMMIIINFPISQIENKIQIAISFHCYKHFNALSSFSSITLSFPLFFILFWYFTFLEEIWPIHNVREGHNSYIFQFIQLLLELFLLWISAFWYFKH